MSVVPDSSADVQIDDITSVTAAVPLPSRTFIDLTIPDSPDSPVQQSSPAPHVPIVRPGEQGSLALMPRRADLADMQGTVFQPVHKQFQPYRTNITVPILAFPAPPTTSAEDLLLWFQRLEETFQLVPDFHLWRKIFTMIAATPAVHLDPLMQYMADRMTDKTLQYEQFKQYLHTLLLSEIPSNIGGGM
ncbi:unnamed protein product [Clavelina lepadiformis]|uniref:Uncharacterized protein n=1 Tax=Clavelina lepadiformis TaxID=159417 RepID=A0ABP0GGU4_CLALP